MRGAGTRGGAMQAAGTPYEVRCPRCDVSFPVETRRCIHCGGATSAAGAPVSVAAFTGSSGGATASGAASPPPAPITIAGSDEEGLPEEPLPQQGIVAALLRSFGSLFWIIALIGFSLARSCSEG